MLQGSVLGPFLFKFYSSNFFYFLDCNIHNFDLKNLDFSLEQLEQQSSIALRWFEKKMMIQYVNREQLNY